MLRLGIIGYGYWGPNIVRNFSATDNVKVVALCDTEPLAINRARKYHPNLKFCRDYRDITTSAEIDAVAIVTPVATHFELSRSALENGKHVFVEKPFVTTADEAEALIELAEKKHLTIMVDHTFLFTGAVRKIKELIDDDVLGTLYYYDSTRVNLGIFQNDVNVIWDLAPHDLSIIDYIIKECPVAVAATGMDHFKRGLEDVAYITVYFDHAIIAHINVNWLSPVKQRTTLIGGQKKMLVWNDLEPDEKIKLYDKGVEVDNKEGVYKVLVDYRVGDMWAPRLDHIEALKTEAEYFVDCIVNDTPPINDGNAGLRVVRVLEAADESLKNKGRLVEL